MWTKEKIQNYLNKCIDNPETYNVDLIYDLFQLIGRKMNIILKENVEEDPEIFKNVYLINIDEQHYEEDEDDPDKETRYILADFKRKKDDNYGYSLYLNRVKSYELLD